MVFSVIRLFAAVAILTVPLAVGCGGTRSDQIPVTGKVSFDGQPVEQGTITFMPVSGVGQTTGAEIVAGSYSTTVSPGEQAVQITANKTVVKENPTEEEVQRGLTESTEQYLPAKFNRQSELRVTVSADATTHNFDLQP